ncbi:MAG: MFS transporter [Pirellulales bacterium]|nr:MFS transporter [Pirellulales bacterium]
MTERLNTSIGGLSTESAEPRFPASLSDEIAPVASSPSDGLAEPSRGSLVVLFLIVFIDLLGFGMIMPLLPNYARQFQHDESGLLIGLLMSSFSLMQFLCAPLWGRWSDKIGRRPVLLIGLAGSVVSYSLFSVATLQSSLWLLFVARIGAGIAGATIPTAQAYIADCTSLGGRARGMALIGAAFGLGFTFGPLFGYFAVTNEQDLPGPGPGYAAAALSALALVLAWYLLPESLVANHHSRRDGGWWNLHSWRAAWQIPGMGKLLLTLLICVLAFANFESTLSMLLKGEIRGESFVSPFQATYGQVLLCYAYVGFTLLVVQGLIVRRLAPLVAESKLAAAGVLIQMLAYGGLMAAITAQSWIILFVALTGVVIGFSFVTPSLNSLVSRWSDPTQQGRILGVSASVSSLARILGPIMGAVLLKRQVAYPYLAAVVLCGLGFGLLAWATREGRDYPGEI